MMLEDIQLRESLCRKYGRILFFSTIKQIFVNIIKGKRLMLIYAPILYETKLLEYLCYPIVVVGCSKNNQIKRLCIKKKSTEELATKKLDRV